MPPEKKLSDEDMARVEEYLSSPIHQVERKPYRPLRLLLVLWVVDLEARRKDCRNWHSSVQLHCNRY